MTKHETKRQKMDHPSAPIDEKLGNIYSLVVTAHQHLKELIIEKQGLDHIVLSKIGDELRVFEKTRREGLLHSKIFNWTMLMQINEAYWHKWFSLKDWQALAICSSTIFAIISPIISTTFFFKQSYFEFSWYSPTKFQKVMDLRLPKGVSHIHFRDDFNLPLFPLPHSVTHLQFGHAFNQEIKALSNSVVSIQIDNDKFNANLHLPQSITHLTLPCTSNDILSTLPNLKVLDTKLLQDPILRFPPTLQILKAKCHPDQRLEVLPPSLLQLDLIDFDGPVDIIPASVIHLNLGDMFDYPVDNLPLFITHLTFGRSFNQPVNSLPPSLTFLQFGESFNHSIDNIPNSITTLTLGFQFDQPVAAYPNSLIDLTVSWFLPETENYPTSFTHLAVYDTTNDFPQNLPPTLTHLYWDNLHKKPIDYLPPSLTHFTCAKEFGDVSSMQNIPQSITNITLLDGYPFPDKELTWQNYIKFPVLENCNVRTTEHGVDTLFHFGDKLKKFIFELVDTDEGIFRVTFYVDFEKHNVGVFWDL